MELKQEIELRQVIKSKLWQGLGGMGLLFVAFVGMWKLSPEPWMEQQENLQRIRRGQVRHFELNFANTPSGNLQNEGTIYFGGDITNYGRMGCGSCKSGTNYLGNSHDSSIYLKGLNPIAMYEAIFEGKQDLHLLTEWYIHQKLRVKQGRIRSSKKYPEKMVHFGEFASYEFYATDFPFIDGWVGKTGSGEFLFPLGSEEGLKGILLTGSHNQSFYQAAFISLKERMDLGILTEIPLFHSHNEDIKIVESGLWLIKGSEESKLIFDRRFDDGLVVLGWKDGHWENLGGIWNEKGLSTKKAIIPNQYEAFTLGK